MSDSRPVGVRLDDRTRRALDDEAADRRMRPTQLARHLIAYGLDTIDTVMPIRRRQQPTVDQKLMQSLLLDLGRIGGNLQRTYTAVSAGGHDDADLLRIKAELRAIADQIRGSLRCGPSA